MYLKPTVGYYGSTLEYRRCDRVSGTLSQSPRRCECLCVFCLSDRAPLCGIECP